MSISGGVIIAPVNQRDIQNALGISSSVKKWSQLCTHSNINRWAKYKPVRYNKKSNITDAERLSVNWGIVDIPTWYRLSYCAIFLFSDNRGSEAQVHWPECDRAKGSLSIDYWAKQLPNGGNNRYREKDYIGYYHDAQEPIRPMQSASIKIDPIGRMHIAFPKGAENSYTLKLSDLTWPGSTSHSLADMYFGVLAKQISGIGAGTTYAVTMKDGSGIDVKMSQVTGTQYNVMFSEYIVKANWTGNWRIYPIISSIPIDETSSISSQDGNLFVCPLPFHNQNIAVSIQYAEVLITSHHGYKDSLSQQRYARFNFQLSNAEASGAYRNYRIDLVICNSSGEQIYGLEGSTTGQIPTGSTSSATISVYIAQHWSAAMYYRATLTITDSGIKFKRDSTVALTGPIPVEGPTPD